TVPCGNAADDEQLILQPHELPTIYDDIARIFEDAAREGVDIFAGNNIGYFGPHEHLWRTLSDRPEPWMGCQAAETAIGIEADGAIKGCPSLDRYRYSGGNIRERPLAEIWRDMAGTVSQRVRPPRWGFCGSCYYGDQCGAGCTWTSGSVSEKPGNNPFCDYRARTLARQGLRERLVRTKPAPGIPFDFATWELLLESEDGALCTAPASYGPPPPEQPGEMVLCPGCTQFAYAGADCPHCGTGLSEIPPPLETTLAQLQHALSELDRINAACASDLEKLRAPAG
ncbi:MAG: SPASM domain-containing protein, partial [Parasphingopyxis sp.]